MILKYFNYRYPNYNFMKTGLYYNKYDLLSRYQEYLRNI